MRRLVCACVVRKPPKTFFLAARPIYVPEDLLNLFLTNSADPDEMSPYVAFLLGLSTCASIQNDNGYMINHTTHLVVDELALGLCLEFLTAMLCVRICGSIYKKTILYTTIKSCCFNVVAFFLKNKIFNIHH